jgi:hypothetical protein
MVIIQTKELSWHPSIQAFLGRNLPERPGDKFILRSSKTGKDVVVELKRRLTDANGRVISKEWEPTTGRNFLVKVFEW